MDNFSEIEDLINKKVKEAINSINLAKGKYNNSEAKNILNNILSGVKNGVELASQKIENAKLEEIKKRNKIIKKEEISLYIAKKPTGKILGTFLTVLGILGICFTSISFIFFLIIFSFSKVNLISVIIVFGIFLIINILITINGTSKLDRIKRFKKYVRCLENKGYCRIDKLSGVINKKEKFVVKDLNKMMELDMFKKGHIDEEKTYFNLPMTIKLISSYIELSEQSIQGENIKNAKKEIEESIDLINKAFENLLNDLFEEVAMDISTDISALKTLFTQDGLTEEEFKK